MNMKYKISYADFNVFSISSALVECMYKEMSN